MLPIESIFPALSSSLSHYQQIILQAPTGAGKSTALPLFLLNLRSHIQGKIILLEPRRLAAKNIAHYLAEQLNEKVGDTVGYRMRGETVVSQHTRLEIVTEGVLTRMLQSDPELTGVAMVIFDEFHERNLQADLGLALCLDVQAGLREDLHILVMSATLDNQPLTELMPDAKVLSCEGRMYPVELHYRSPKNQYIEQDLALLIKQIVANESGNILVFLAGKKEIVNLAKLLQQQEWQDVNICPLYGAMPLNEQRLAIAEPPAGKRKIVLATNIAETSLTIAGISVVVDSMRERRLKLDHKTGIGTLTTRLISQAAATQRMGRAGRIQAGSCYRLINKEIYASLEQHSLPDIMVADLSALVLELAGWGVQQADALSWLTLPPERNWQQAVNLLNQLGALTPSGQLTAHGQAILGFSGSPREAHMLLAAKELEQKFNLVGFTALAAKLAVLLNQQQREFDLSRAVEARLNKVEQQQYLQTLKKLALAPPATLPVALTGLALVLAYPDRIARKRAGNSDHWLLSSGLGVKLYSEQSLFNQEWLVIPQLGGVGKQQELLAFTAAPLELSTLKQYQPHLFHTHHDVSWDASINKVKGTEQTRVGAIVLSSQPLKKINPELRTQALLQGILALPELPLTEAALAYIGLVEYARSLMPELALPELSQDSLRQSIDVWLAPYISDLTSLEQVKKLDMLNLIKQRLTWPQQQALADYFPRSYTTPAGSTVKVQYEGNKPPVIAVKMQHMFGLSETPKIANGRAAITILLLSPAGRPLQTTQDLVGFWQGSYKDVQKEMKGRYPKHFWPDDPSAAQATTKTKKFMNSEQ
ncbi:ATP-dependent helicase HrpB [Motilimonas cestriensis]|uniref:ATP-dependent helicase HrpB n=1 Tax=Motilimonas cestriensis TaxID=2742685 RepID=A0ABS8WBU3_9GAMM|nr:ATP-dependent helicase HrpB [Motilimonas cestriensis]